MQRAGYGYTITNGQTWPWAASPPNRSWLSWPDLYFWRALKMGGLPFNVLTIRSRILRPIHDEELHMPFSRYSVLRSDGSKPISLRKIAYSGKFGLSSWVAAATLAGKPGQPVNRKPAAQFEPPRQLLYETGRTAREGCPWVISNKLVQQLYICALRRSVAWLECSALLALHQ